MALFTPSTPTALGTRVEELSHQLTRMGDQLTTIQASLHLRGNSSSGITSSQLSSDGTQMCEQQQSSCQAPKSYSSVVSPDLVLVVKSVVADSFKEQRITNEYNSSVVIHGVPESKDDLIKVRDLFKLVNCADSLLNVFRMGKYNTPPAGRKLYRPLKLIFQSRGDLDYVLNYAKVISTSAEKTLPGIYITKLFTVDEIRAI